MMSQIIPFIFILITLYLNNQVSSSPSPPVIFWSTEALPKSTAVPLSTISSLDLVSDNICKLNNEQIQFRIFAVNDLNIESIQLGRQRNHPLLVEARKGKTNFRYYPKVSNDAYKTFSLISRSNNMKCSHIHFEVVEPRIYDTLEDALNIMQTTIDYIKSEANTHVVIALINAPDEGQPHSRQRRQTNSTEGTVLISNNNTCMFYAKQLRWNTVNGTFANAQNYSLNFGASSCQPNAIGPNNSSMTLDLSWTNDNVPSETINVRLTTVIIGVYWYLTNATINNQEYRYFAFGMHDEMTTPPRYSYVCTTATFVWYTSAVPGGQYNFSNKFYIAELQFQPFYVTNFTFGPPNYCTSFFTSGIWMAITTSLLCIAALLFGVHRIMAIKSNDRFDDPKGKPLIIKAQE